MRKAGWFRLWLLLTVLGVPSAAIWQSQRDVRFWSELDKITIHNCVETEWASPNHPDAPECGHRLGVDKTFFEREGTTPILYWSSRVGVAFLADLVLTGLLVALTLSIRWVVRGFRGTDVPKVS